jgi:predicted RNase H-like HicB family nuclease
LWVRSISRKIPWSLCPGRSRIDHPWSNRMEANLRYRVLISWSDEDGAFIAEVPELPGCAADGRTYQEAVANVEIIMCELIETARSLKRQIPVPGGN